jgi:catechol 2,3-dioxygenase-like lactoylglutathione lyase family enzyme
MTLRSHVNRIVELTVNVFDLEKSLAFYRALTPLCVLPGPRLGSPSRRLGWRTAASSVLSWPTAAPGNPACWFTSSSGSIRHRSAPLTQRSSTAVSTGSVSSPTIVDARYEQALTSGHAPFLSPKDHGVPVPGGSEGLSFVCPNPYGIAARTTRRPAQWREDLPDQLYHVNIVSSEIDRSRLFLQDILGLDYVNRRVSDPARAAGLPEPLLGQPRRAGLRPAGRRDPGPQPEPPSVVRQWAASANTSPVRSGCR